MNLIWIVVAVLFALWLVGLLFGVVGSIIHILLIVIVALAIYGFIKRRV
ncbi:MAG TPA: lmo0937 family membrane protein [Thermoanaerobaculia bacterium]|nr:lmo0937 family membrane protein [Thermoanaerobaculia bacterium]